MASIWDKEGESGLIDNFEFSITKSWFATNEKYQNGTALLLHWEGTTDQLDFPIQNVWYSFGSGWVSKDGGESIVHESGNPDKFFQKNSQYNKIIQRCTGEFGLKELFEERGADPFHADMWVGLKFLMVSEEQEKIRDKETGEDKTPRPKLFPAAYLGLVEETPKGKKAAAPKAAAKETGPEKIARLKAEKAAKEAGDSGDGEVTLRDQVKAILLAEDDFEVAQTAALALDGVMDDDDLVMELMDEEGLFTAVREEVAANA
jgi:hypothetical protein